MTIVSAKSRTGKQYAHYAAHLADAEVKHDLCNDHATTQIWPIHQAANNLRAPQHPSQHLQIRAYPRTNFMRFRSELYINACALLKDDARVTLIPRLTQC